MGRLRMTEKEMRLIIGAVMRPDTISDKVQALRDITFCSEEDKFRVLGTSIPDKQYTDVIKVYFAERN